MPMCNICGERWYRESEVDPEESCLCGERFSYDLWADSGSWREYGRLRWLQFRWRVAKWAWKVCEWITPKV